MSARETKRPKMSTEVATDVESPQVGDDHIDDSLYSRQRYVLGDGAMQRLSKSNVLVSGAGGLGIEIAKNIVLAGVKAFTIHDTAATTIVDLGTQFFLTSDHVGTNRATASASALSELNPYVRVESSTQQVLDKDFVETFQCVILTETSLEEQVRINNICRSHNPPIKFINTDVCGLFGVMFVDFGTGFEVIDASGEESKQVMISDVSQEETGIVTAIDNRMHALEDGDNVYFSEVEGMTELNGPALHTVKVLSPFKFSIGDTTKLSKFSKNGIAHQVHRKRVMQFDSLETQLATPSLLITDYAKMESPSNTWLAYRAMHQFKSKHGRLPKPRSEEDFPDFMALTEACRNKDQDPELNPDLIKTFSYTCSGSLAPMCATFGGWAAQECIKGLTGKFTPLLQVLCLDAIEVGADLKTDVDQFQPKGDRYDALRICVGQDTCDQLAKAKLFMVGCGAIGCEMLKNYALLGVSTHPSSAMRITDNDVIEKSNLNRQFLFRPQHIQQPKSVVAAASALQINPQINIVPDQHKVGPETTKTVYNDDFFEGLDVVVNALDNVQARLFMDSRCVSTRRALLESGTMGAKGHVQTIVPDLTESYASQRDPPEADVPYCTLKSFPSTIEHTIQWARDKFANLFELKPAEFNKFWESNGDLETVLASMRGGDCGKSFDTVELVIKLLKRYPQSWQDCISLSRAKFEKYFNHKAQHLLHAFPLETKLPDGSSFWQSPKRPPSPLTFNTANELHIDFVKSIAILFAKRYEVAVTAEDLNRESLVAAINQAPVPQFVAKTDQKVVTDEHVKKEASTKASVSADDFATIASVLETICAKCGDRNTAKLNAAVFEKDDDANGHIDFITAASNLRASVYGIETVDRFKTKLVAGKIVPAIATTTACVAGLVSIELIKIIKKAKLEDYRNAFLNLALPFMILTEPAKPIAEELVGDRTWTLWDKWEVQGSLQTTLAEFISAVKDQYGLEPASVINGASMAYMSIFPQHQKRLSKTMKKLLKPQPKQRHIDLTVTFGKGLEDVTGPPIRFYFKDKK